MPLADCPRQLETLERLLEIPAADLRASLAQAATAVALALRADKVDVFLHDPSRDSLVAGGASDQPLSALQRRVGLDVLPIANGGRAVQAFQSGTFASGDVENDEQELRGIREVLKVRSMIGVPLDIGGARRGALMIVSLKPNFFSADDVRFAEAVAKWVGMVEHRAELTEEIAKNALEQGRRAVAEELITVLAHDLRNHLSPIALRLSVLKRRAERDERAGDVRDLQLSQRAVERLSELISDLLDVARIDQGVFSMTVEEIDLAAIVGEIAQNMTTAEHRIDVKASEDVIASGDPKRIRQCLENLVSNAVNHSPRDGVVTIFLRRAAERSGETAIVEIADEGPGISAELLPHIFDRFVVGKSKTTGLGLGLYIAKRIAVMHGGELQVESEPGRGARFILSLPALGS